MTVPVTGITPIFGIEYLVEGEPAFHTRAKMERNAAQIEAALAAGPASPPGAADLLAVSGRVSTLETDKAGRPWFQLKGVGNGNLANATWLPLNLAAEQTDPLGGHDNATASSRWTCPAGWGGWWMAVGSISWGGNATGRRFAGIRKNGVETTQANTTLIPNGTATAVQQGTGLWMFQLAPTDYLELWGYQDSGVVAPGLGVNLANSGFMAVRMFAS